MKVGIPREVKNHEYRVAITPSGVHELVRLGHEVFVEKEAGVGSSIPDDDYVGAGARILDSADDVWDEPGVARATRWVGAGALVLVVVVLIVRFGSPVTMARHAYDSFVRTTPTDTGNLNDRIFSLSSNGRIPWTDAKCSACWRMTARGSSSL